MSELIENNTNNNNNFILKNLNKLLFYKIYYENNFRPDFLNNFNRKLNNFRPISLNKHINKTNCNNNDNLYGSSEVFLGNTGVICGVNYSVGTPHLLSPDQGEVICDVSIGPLGAVYTANTDAVTSTARTNKTEEEQEIEGFLLDVLFKYVQYKQLLFYFSYAFFCILI